AIENNVKKVIYVSTDKAADPVNTYGMTKALGEKLMVHASLQKTNTQFVTIRGGNVLGSSGSVLPLFQKQIAELEEVHITDKRMVRYFISPEDAIKRLLKAAQVAKNGDILVMNMDAFRIIDLAEVLIEQSRKEDVKVIEIGIRPGEKIEEVLIADGEKSSTYLIDDELFVITQHTDVEDYTPLKDDLSHQLLQKDDIKSLLKKSNFI
ncbi:MAG: polysaccharide biosynthesis protein, partial [Lysinibacillus sp.]